MLNVMRYEPSSIYNVIGVINSTDEDEAIIIGNYHDSLTIGGAAEPILALQSSSNLLKLLVNCSRPGGSLNVLLSFVLGTAKNTT